MSLSWGSRRCRDTQGGIDIPSFGWQLCRRKARAIVILYNGRPSGRSDLRSCGNQLLEGARVRVFCPEECVSMTRRMKGNSPPQIMPRKM